MDNANPSMRTDDVAQKIEYVTAAKWTPDQYKKVCGILRMFRHQSILDILDRAAGGTDDSEGGKGARDAR